MFVQSLSPRTLKAEGHIQVKMKFLYLFSGLRGGTNRIRIMLLLKNKILNANQISTQIDLEYKATSHHLKVLEKNNMIKKIGNGYGTSYSLSSFFKANQQIFEEIKAVRM